MANAGGKIDWLASYPKSGNTWMRLLLANYFNEKDEPHDINKPGVTNGIASSRWRFDELLGIPSSDLTEDEITGLRPFMSEIAAEQGATRQWMKVHDAQMRLPGGQWLFPASASGCAIYLIRNPLDVAVSRAFHDGHGDMDKAVAMVCGEVTSISGPGKSQLRQFMGDWSYHVASWVDQVEIPVLVIRYEDMLEDAARELTRVLNFARPDDAIDPARLAAAVANTSFDKLQSAEAQSGFRERTTRQERFFRSGKAGDWRNHLSAAQAKRIADTHQAMMQRFDFDMG
jgi:aryl sulfotransferase